MRGWYAANEECRGSSGEASAKACARRDEFDARLSATGWCWAYRDPSVPPARYGWHRCDDEPPAFTASATATISEGRFRLNAFETIVLALLALAYFVPTAIAVARRRRNWPAIAALNILAGWTFVGWVGALVWSLLRDASAD